MSRYVASHVPSLEALLPDTSLPDTVFSSWSEVAVDERTYSAIVINTHVFSNQFVNHNARINILKQ